ncbi:hypothetical protein HKX48_001643, partial [Thoreauomyces humboldtii]
MLETIRRGQAEDAMVGSGRELEEMRERVRVAEQAVQSKSNFLSTVSHEIRTPLNGILGLGTLLADTPLNTDQHDLLKSLRECSDGLLLIVNDVLDFSKIDAGKLDLDFRPFDLVACVQGAVHLLDFNASPKGIEITQTVDAATPRYVVGDCNRLRQVLINLLGNAVKFTDRGRVNVRVHAEEVESTGDAARAVRVQFEVEDTGIGIPASAMDRLFQSFSQIDNSNSRRYGGTGLGLAISKRLVELMDSVDGRMWATSSHGNGSTFFVSMVMVVCTQEAMRTAGVGMRETEAYSWLDGANSRTCGETHEGPSLPIAPAADGTVGSRPKVLAERLPIRILVAEDNIVNQKLTLRLLQKLGYTSATVDLVQDGKEAVTAIEQTDYDLVFMDVQMPNMSGIEATRTVRSSTLVESRRQLQPVILALTANAMEADRELCLLAGMNGHISKPVKLETLARMIELHGAPRIAAKLQAAASQTPTPQNSRTNTTESV